MKIFITCVLCFLVASLVVATVKLSRFGKVDAPYIKHVMLDEEGEIVNDSFDVKTKCNYQINFHMVHKNNVYNEYKDILPERKLPVSIELQIDAYKEGVFENVFRDVRKPMIQGLGLKLTGLNFGNTFLDEGRYRIKCKVLDGSLSSLHSIVFVLRVEVKPKTTCAH